MDNLLLNLLADRYSRAFRDLKKDRSGRINHFVGKHNIGETVTAQKQATGSHRKISAHFAHYLLTFLTIRKGLQASNRHTKKLVCKMLTICSLSLTFL